MTPIDVFLSSTCYDLGDLRAELGEYLRQNAFLVRMSDDYASAFVASGQTDSITSCLVNAENADVVVCLLDRRYGPRLPPGHAYAGKSATHAELLHARSKGRPIFTFVRDRSIVDHEQVLADPDFKPKWVDARSKDDLVGLIKEQKDLALATSGRHSNWFDQFRSSVDLKPLVLKRLLDQFPGHAGAFTRRPERMVRMYFKMSGANKSGAVFGTFVNAGNGPALDVECGWVSRSKDQAWERQGGVAVGSEMPAHRNPPVPMACPPRQPEVVIYCQYSNTWGDRFRLEAPLRWAGESYKQEAPEQLLAWAGGDGGMWIKVR